MLSKSQAKLFFLLATGGFSGVFLWLTVDTLGQVPERSHESALSDQVVRGKEIWESNNCMGCHTILGEGAYYAPELTRAYTRRGEAWLTTFLRDPQAMYPGQRKMVQYDFSDEEIADVVAFLRWVGEVDTNGFPAEPDLAPAAPTALASAPAPASGAHAASGSPSAPPAVFTQICTGCHSVGGQGGRVGPALDGVGTRFTPAAMHAWLDDPQSVRPGTAMPDLPLSAAELDGLTTYLMTLQ